MAKSGSTESGMRWGSSDEPGREWGARRRKVYGYLKAANELRQIYASQWSQRNRQDSYDGESFDVPGAFPDVDIARSGDEEMVLFPSYTRRHVRKKRPGTSCQLQRKPGTNEDIERPRSPGDLEYWKQEWEKYEDDNASVDVDVRGWIYTPQHGPMSRKHRLLIALARKLSGIPAPGTSSNSSPLSGQLGPQQASSKREDEDVAREAQSIINRAEQEADPAWKGGHFRGQDGQQGSDAVSRTDSTSSLGKDELSVANARLMERLRPFMANPLVGTPVTMFFFNDKESLARTTTTDDAGHFSFRASLEFVPTHVRVIASESLSATEEVQIIEPKGVSLISDIDDTIKHTAITSGAKEMFRNTFVRELEDLTIPGIKEWYTKMANMGVRMHYVSNSPWQLYPLLKRYFTLAGLPPGSFHLKQYSGMLQGIFEPTAERKRGALEKIMADFPERKFILVGDSGEADLEVYTDLVLANPGRVLAVFIRDITTPEKKGFFDQSFDHNSVSRPSPRTAPVKNDSDAVENRPALPPRRPVEQQSNSTSADARTLDNTDLISLMESGNETDQNPDSANRKCPPVKPSKPTTLRTTSADPATQSKSNDEEGSSTVPQKEIIRRKPAPPLPSKPRSLSIPRPDPSAERPPPLPARPKPNPATDSPASSALQSAKNEPSQPAESYTGAVKNMISTAYNSLPSTAREYLSSRSNTPNDSGTESQPGEERRTRSQRPPPPVPPPRRSNTAASTASSASAGPETRRGPTSNANAASHDRVLKPSSSSSSLSARGSASASSRPVPSRTNTNTSTTSATTTNNNNDYDSGLTYHDPSDGSPQPAAPLPNKREELWRRRWERAQAVLDEHGVILACWRVGSDVEDIAVWLVEEAQKRE
ncbi:hypothetical protein VTN96DRAFT_2243 [Rasamsonia emersonii]|uniref:Actin cytoskeleton organization protein App1 n=1 Tax=Rasamsonia emersonii (strain ATCC 16479 / CBS 393.64 / IMI 116815) TaxID=1408163 RepID=A0A0F4Z2H3_RASE3|nr:Actin cytoskeleton organization protein App1 [Rasamsonia emersonii CBS 393.64]KKA24709.1 Actin cytoskeleton organization protein App1 [Rasamsonia emersonii CBS 393.64]